MRSVLWAKVILISSHLISPLYAQSRLIGGKPVDPGTWNEVVRITVNGSTCTATIVGPKVLLTAASCGATGATASFQINNKKYDAKIVRSSLYPAKDHNIAIGVTSEPITNVEPASVGGKAVSGLNVNLLGFGCSTAGGGGSDGILRIGDSTVTGFSGFDMVLKRAGGAALCFGDQGGPVVVTENGKHFILGVGSQGNLQDTSYSARTDTSESATFLKSVADSQSLAICGVNQVCGGTDPVEPAPSCSLTANPSEIKLGSALVLNFIGQGKITAAAIDGESITFPTGTKTLTPTTLGTFTARATVTGPGGSNTCATNYTVKAQDPLPPSAPTCSLTASPETVLLGNSVTIEMMTSGQVTAASIDGTSVSFPMGKKIVTPTMKGTFTANGSVSGPGGSSFCRASYTVEEQITPIDPTTPNFAVVPAYCGDNEIAETPVSRVCLGVISKSSQSLDLKISQVLLITYRDTSKEVMPIVLKKTLSSDASDAQIKEELVSYANNSVLADKFLVLDTRTATLTKNATRRGDIPVSLTGRSAKGYYYSVSQLSTQRTDQD